MLTFLLKEIIIENTYINEWKIVCQKIFPTDGSQSISKDIYYKITEKYKLDEDCRKNLWCVAFRKSNEYTCLQNFSKLF